MKSITMIVILMVASFAGTASASLNTAWGNVGAAVYLYNAAGTSFDTIGAASYQVQLVIDVNGDTDMSALAAGNIGLTGDGNGWASYIDSSAADDVIWTADMRDWTSFGSGQYAIPQTASEVDDIYASSPFYFRFFDADSQLSATEAGFLYGSGGTGNLSGWNLATGPTDPDPPAVSFDYGAGDALGTSYTLGVNDGWATVQPVPEPGTMALFALGLATLGVSRRRRKVQA